MNRLKTAALWIVMLPGLALVAMVAWLRNLGSGE